MNYRFNGYKIIRKLHTKLRKVKQDYKKKITGLVSIFFFLRK